MKKSIVPSLPLLILTFSFSYSVFAFDFSPEEKEELYDECLNSCYSSYNECMSFNSTTYGGFSTDPDLAIYNAQGLISGSSRCDENRDYCENGCEEYLQD